MRRKVPQMKEPGMTDSSTDKAAGNDLVSMVDDSAENPSPLVSLGNGKGSNIPSPNNLPINKKNIKKGKMHPHVTFT